MQIVYRATHPKAFLDHLAAALDLPVQDGRITVPARRGEGHITQVPLSEHLVVTDLDLCFRQAVDFIREAAPGAPFYPILFYLPDQPIQQDLEDQTLWVGPRTPHGVFWASPGIHTRYHAPAGRRVTALTIALHRDWFAGLGPEAVPEHVAETLGRDAPFFFMEPLTASMLGHLRRIRAHLWNGTSNRVRLTGWVHLLLADLFEALSGRPPAAASARVNGDDAERVVDVIAWMKTHLDEPITVEGLAYRAGMSPAKLQRLFRAIVGASVYQHFLTLRMHEALRLLQRGRFSVSEVGYRLGYTNLSHFARAFRKVFGLLPSDVDPSAG